MRLSDEKMFRKAYLSGSYCIIIFNQLLLLLFFMYILDIVIVHKFGFMLKEMVVNKNNCYKIDFVFLFS